MRTVARSMDQPHPPKRDQLPPGWFVAAVTGDASPQGSCLLIGPGGVFTISVEHHAGRTWICDNALVVSGRRTDSYGVARAAARQATESLSDACGFPVSAEPIIAITNTDADVRSLPADVHVLHRAHLARWLRERPRVLSDHTVDAIHDHTRRSPIDENVTHDHSDQRAV
jgi:hypothetical protein